MRHHAPNLEAAVFLDFQLRESRIGWCQINTVLPYTQALDGEVPINETNGYISVVRSQ